MGLLTHIAWTDHTFNPWIGCTKVSPGCKNCYAEKQDLRWNYTEDGWGPDCPRHRTKSWGDPIKWNRLCAANGSRDKVFCGSMCDVMDDDRTSPLNEWRAALWQLISATPNLDWQLLTKRPQNYRKYLPREWLRDGLPANIWLGSSVEDQKRAEERIHHLLDVPAQVRFISAEPLLEAVDFTPWLPNLHWVIVGGESGHHFRPMHTAWALDIRNQCAAHDVAFFFKQHSGIHPKALGDLLDGGSYHSFPAGTGI